MFVALDGTCGIMLQFN